MATSDTSLELYQRPQTAAEIRAQVNLIQEVMRAVMKENVHYGIIPNCQKPSLWKPGAEVLFATFRVAVDPAVEDLSNFDEARFRVIARATSNHGLQLGSAMGEASSSEEKYKWREVVCDEEWDATAEDQRRHKWKRGKQGAWSIRQVRTQIADCRNTILKMAAKRASVALALQVTAASDIFTQDIEDVPEEVRESVTDDVAAPEPLPTEIRKKESPQPVPAAAAAQASVPPSQPAPRPAPQAQRPPIQSPRPNQVRCISEPQARRFYGIYMQAGRSKEEVKQHLREEIGTEDDRQIPVTRYEELCAWASGEGKF